jgi:hypothetical protein
MQRPIGACQADLISLASKPGGTSTSEAAAACGAAMNHVSASFSRMVKRGHVVRAHVTGHSIRWFTEQSAADAWQRATQPRVALDSRRKQKPALDAKPIAVITRMVRGVKVTKQIAPAYDARFHVDPRAKCYGAGFASAGLGIDITTGQAWES